MYCIGDINGRHGLFMDLMSKLEGPVLSIGNVISGDEGIKALMYIINNDSIDMILGNDEKSFLNVRDIYEEIYNSEEMLYKIREVLVDTVSIKYEIIENIKSIINISEDTNSFISSYKNKVIAYHPTEGEYYFIENVLDSIKEVEEYKLIPEFLKTLSFGNFAKDLLNLEMEDFEKVLDYLKGLDDKKVINRGRCIVMNKIPSQKFKSNHTQFAKWKVHQNYDTIFKHYPSEDKGMVYVFGGRSVLNQIFFPLYLKVQRTFTYSSELGGYIVLDNARTKFHFNTDAIFGYKDSLNNSYFNIHTGDEVLAALNVDTLDEVYSIKGSFFEKRYKVDPLKSKLDKSNGYKVLSLNVSDFVIKKDNKPISIKSLSNSVILSIRDNAYEFVIIKDNRSNRAFYSRVSELDYHIFSIVETSEESIKGIINDVNQHALRDRGIEREKFEDFLRK